MATAIAIASAKDNYGTWQTITGPERMPTEPCGDGLPTNLINDLLIARDGTVYAATTLGLAASKDKGQSWRYWRGADYAAKVKGLYGGVPEGWKPSEGAWLAEDYVTCLAEDVSGNILVGYRQKGYALVQPEIGKQLAGGSPSSDYVNALLALPNTSPIVGMYGAGVQIAGLAMLQPSVGNNLPIPVATSLAFPASAPPPGSVELAQMFQQAKAPKDPLPCGGAVALYQDWRTQGDWVGRYGRLYTILCATNSPFNHQISHSVPYLVDEDIGPNHDPGDSVRNWIHWKHTNDPRVLYNPCLGYRRQAEWDDHGEAYPRTHEGPDIWVKVVVPTGVHRLSLYFFNKDGHEGANRYRDYLIEIKDWESDEAQRLAGRTLAKSRVRDFWGGQYSSFLLTGSGAYAIHIARQSSLNTIVSAVMLDKLEGTAIPADNEALPFMAGVRYDPPKPGVYSPSFVAVGRIWNALQERRYCPRQVIEAQYHGILLYRFAAQSGVSEKLLGNWRWSLRLWMPTDRVEWAASVRKGRETFATINGLEVEKGYGK